MLKFIWSLQGLNSFDQLIVQPGNRTAPPAEPSQLLTAFNSNSIILLGLGAACY